MQQKHVKQDNHDDSVLEQKPVNEKIEENVQEVVGKAEQEVTRSSVPWYRAPKRAYLLIGIYAVQLALFALLVWFVHVHPIIAIDVTITHEFQENRAPWLSATMFAVS